MRRFFFLLLIPGPLFAAANKPVKVYQKTLLSLNAGHTSIVLDSGSYSDPGYVFSLGRFLKPKFALTAHYALTADTNGSSNLNGLGLEARYYFYHTEAGHELKAGDSRIRSFDRIFSYVSLQFLDRDVRTSRINISYSGFGLALGAGLKFDYHQSLSLMALIAQLKNAYGAAAAKSATYTHMGLVYSYLF